MPGLLSIIGIGLAMGIVHVLTGPDHLSALATLAVGRSVKSSFGLGVRWGCGHSFGLLIVAIAFFAMGTKLNLKPVTYYADLIVGFFMIALGVYYSLKAVRMRVQYQQSMESAYLETIDIEQSDRRQIDVLTEPNNVGSSLSLFNHNSVPQLTDKPSITPLTPKANAQCSPPPTLTPDREINIEMVGGANESRQKYDSNDENHDNEEHDAAPDQISEPGVVPDTNSTDSVPLPDVEVAIASDIDDADPTITDSHLSQCDFNRGEFRPNEQLPTESMSDVNALRASMDSTEPILTRAIMQSTEEEIRESMKSKCYTRIAAFAAGILAGVAGPGGVLGVMVSVKLHDWLLSSVYLSMFFLSSILTMAGYASFYSVVTQFLSQKSHNEHLCNFWLKVFSASLSIAVGLIWLVLVFTDTMNKVFN